MRGRGVRNTHIHEHRTSVHIVTNSIFGICNGDWGWGGGMGGGRWRARRGREGEEDRGGGWKGVNCVSITYIHA